MLSLEAQLEDLLQKSEKILLQNTLMRFPDRTLAISLMNLADEPREYALSLISEQKVKRINVEMLLPAVKGLHHDQYQEILSETISVLKGESHQMKSGSYIRPKWPSKNLLGKGRK